MNQESITTDATSFGDLPPEVHEMVASHLNSNDLRLSVLVSKSWRAIFHRYLWRHVETMLDLGSDIDHKRVNLPKVNLLKANREHVHSLTLWSVWGDGHHGALPSFLELLPPSSNPRPVFPNLDSAEIDAGLEESTDQAIAQLLELTGAKWKRLVLNGDEYLGNGINFGPRSMKVLARHAEFLEVFRCRSEASSTDRLLQLLLCSAPKLKELSVVGYYGLTAGGWLDARKIVEMEWVCLGLEVFQCRIGNIPRPDITRNIGDNPADVFVVKGSLQESLDLQCQVYTKLAKLTRLRELKLDLESCKYTLEYELDETYRRQFDCLAMTLDSGLDLLKGLKELRVVQLEDMEVYVKGEREQAWFKEHWPHAKIELGEEFDKYL